LVLHERAERFGNKVDLPGNLLVGSAQPVESDAEPLVELGRAAPLQPCTESIGKDRGLRRAWLRGQRFQPLRQIVRQIKLVPGLESFHVADSGVDGRLTADARGRTSALFDES
jgi:hypothetical protein